MQPFYFVRPNQAIDPDSQRLKISVGVLNISSIVTSIEAAAS